MDHQKDLEMSKWKLGFVLPDCAVDQSFDSTYVALVPLSDARIEAITKNNRASQVLLQGFRTHHGYPIYPSALIYRNDVPATVGQDGLIAFRNAVAFSHLGKEWVWKILRPLTWGVLWSDYFNIYPWQPTKNQCGLVAIAPAVNGWDDDLKGFHGQNSPHLPIIPGSLRFYFDERLFIGLLKAWCMRFEKGNLGQWKTKALFRSLEVAFQAAAIPSTNHGTLSDFGTNLALWVSAFEILVHKPPNTKGSPKADKFQVIDLLNQFPWSNAALQHERWQVPKAKKKKLQITFPQKLYCDLYNARNDFLHGNPVCPDRLLRSGRQGSVSQGGIAHLLYKAALYAYLPKIGVTMRRNPFRDIELEEFENALISVK